MGILNSELVKHIKQFEKMEKELDDAVSKYTQAKTMYVEYGEELKSKIDQLSSDSKEINESLTKEIEQVKEKLYQQTMDKGLMSSNKEEYDKQILETSNELTSLQQRSEMLCDTSGTETKNIERIHKAIKVEIDKLNKLASEVLRCKNNIAPAVKNVDDIIGKIDGTIYKSRQKCNNYLVEYAYRSKDAVLRNPMRDIIEYVSGDRAAHNIHEEFGCDMTGSGNTEEVECPENVKRYPSKETIYGDYISKTFGI